MNSAPLTVHAPFRQTSAYNHEEDRRTNWIWKGRLTEKLSLIFDRVTYRHTYRQTHRQVHRYAGRQIHRQVETTKQTKRK